MHNTSRILVLATLIACALPGWSAEPATATATAATAAPTAAGRAAADMAQAAASLWAALSAEQQAKATFALDDAERYDWNFVPKARKGLSLKDMTHEQRLLAHSFLNTAMSNRGYTKALAIMSLDEILRITQTTGPTRDTEAYYFSVFGTPSPTGTWGWRFEGHHLSLNITVVGGQAIVAAPSFFGANPGKVLQGPRAGLRTLAEEEDMGRQLARSLDADQLKAAVIADEVPAEIVTAKLRKVEALAPAGLAVKAMTPVQRQLLLDVVREYAHRHRPEIAAQTLERIEQAGIDAIRFAWVGKLDVGAGHYYRIQGPTFLIEYDNTQNNANHPHTIWRDLENDFGEDLLKKHYELHRDDKAHTHDK